MHGLSSISASWSRSKLKTKNTKPMWYHSYINNDTHRLPHIWPYIFTPLHQPKTPVFAKNCHPKSHCPSVQNFGNFSLKDLLSAGIWEKGYPNAAYFVMAFVTERPPIFLPCIHMFVWGECCLKHGQKLENFVFSEQNRAIWGILSGANLLKGDETKISFLQAQPTQLCIIWMNFIGGQGWYRLLLVLST